MSRDESRAPNPNQAERKPGQLRPNLIKTRLNLSVNQRICRIPISTPEIKFHSNLKKIQKSFKIQITMINFKSKSGICSIHNGTLLD